MLGETILPLTSRPGDRMCPLFTDDGHAHPGIGCLSGDSGYCSLGFAWTLSVSTGALSGGCYLTKPPEPSWQDGNSYQLDG